MEIERTRGISVTSSALQFEYGGCVINLLDTPGHEDFSEDTYRTLMAVDCAVMVLDAAKGVEAQTRRLFEVCRLRQTPILTFINKFDQPGRAPIELLDEIERTLSIPAIPLNWPIGTGPTFQGVYDHGTNRVLRFERSSKGRRAPMEEMPLHGDALREAIGDAAATELRDDIALLKGTLPDYDVESFLAGRQTPVFFGSALHDFGIEPFLDALVESGATASRPRNRGRASHPPGRAVFRVRVQDPGEHGPSASRSDGVPADLLRAVHEGHDRPPRAAAARAQNDQVAPPVWTRSGNRRERLSR